MCPSRSIIHRRTLEASEASESCITELGGKNAKSSFSFNHSRSEWDATEGAGERERETSGSAAEQHWSDDKATAIVQKEQKLATVSAPRGNLEAVLGDKLCSCKILSTKTRRIFLTLSTPLCH